MRADIGRSSAFSAASEYDHKHAHTSTSKRNDFKNVDRFDMDFSPKAQRAHIFLD